MLTRKKVARVCTKHQPNKNNQQQRPTRGDPSTVRKPLSLPAHYRRHFIEILAIKNKQWHVSRMNKVSQVETAQMEELMRALRKVKASTRQPRREHHHHQVALLVPLFPRRREIQNLNGRQTKARERIPHLLQAPSDQRIPEPNGVTCSML